MSWLLAIGLKLGIKAALSKLGVAQVAAAIIAPRLEGWLLSTAKEASELWSIAKKAGKTDEEAAAIVNSQLSRLSSSRPGPSDKVTVEDITSGRIG